ncbi:hypothetical protein AVEN_199855-1 [Araneus ventricosus]|uniref:Uncharacterized protein n=1 Tax=Araneus ventricosus TaxID=182803 RepID=A0A4Y2DUJ4_ARAVE|nr:hypothetical protein AVEN_199855-1 [Araneus ventricosus]
MKTFCLESNRNVLSKLFLIKYIFHILTFRLEATRRLFWYEAHNFELWSGDNDIKASPYGKGPNHTSGRKFEPQGITTDQAVFKDLGKEPKTLPWGYFRKFSLTLGDLWNQLRINWRSHHSRHRFGIHRVGSKKKNVTSIQ